MERDRMEGKERGLSFLPPLARMERDRMEGKERGLSFLPPLVRAAD
jgi:hypothetical protein